MTRPRQMTECPVCGHASVVGEGHFFFDLRSRRRGYIHPDCFDEIYVDMDPECVADRGDVIALTVDGPGLLDADRRLTVHLFNDNAELLASENILLEESPPLKDSVGLITGQPIEQTRRDLVFFNARSESVGSKPERKENGDFLKKRRRITRELRQSGLF